MTSVVKLLAQIDETNKKKTRMRNLMLGMPYWGGVPGASDSGRPDLVSVSILGPAPLQKCVGAFCCVNFGGFCRDFPGGFFLGTFSHKNEEKKSGDKSPKESGGPKIKNPRKIRSAKNRP